MPEVVAKLPVTMKTTRAGSYIYSTPPNTYIPPGPPHIYAPNQIAVQPVKPPVIYLPPTTTTTTTPANVYLPPNAYLPPSKPSVKPPIVAYLPPTKPTVKPPVVAYLPPTKPSVKPPVVYLPPVTNRPSISLEIVPPALPSCSSSTSCCEEATAGKFVIPIPLKSGSSNGCCRQVAKLILPINGFDDDSIRKLKESVSDEIDATQLIRKILANLL